MKAIKKSAAVLLVLTMIFALTACGKKATITGTWGYSENNVEYTYIFNEDGTGSISITSDITISVTYTTKDGKVTITSSMLGTSQTDEYEYSIKGSTLTLKDGDTTFTLEKK